MMDNPMIILDTIRNLRTMFREDGFDIRAVGGSVRDTLVGEHPKDHDFCTDANPDQQLAIYRRNGLRHIPTGIDHGTISVVMEGIVYEITSLREDVETDGRHAKVRYTRDWIADLSRRDLTINAMAMTLDGELIDPHGGRNDLANGRVRFVGDAETRMGEDHLRILRWIRFHGRFGRGAPLDRDAVEGVGKAKGGLVNISVERIASEVKRIVAGPNGPAMIQAIHDLRLPIGLPKGDMDRLARMRERVSDGAVLLGVYVGDAMVDPLFRSWRMSNQEIAAASFVARHSGTDYDPVELLVMQGADLDHVEALVRADGIDMPVNVPGFPVRGSDLRSTMQPGPAMGRRLAYLKRMWWDGGCGMSKDDLLMVEGW